MADKVKTYEEMSRERWGKRVQPGEKYVPTDLQLAVGALCRIAAALEGIKIEFEVLNHGVDEVNINLDPGARAEREAERQRNAEWDAGQETRNAYHARVKRFLKLLGGLDYNEREHADWAGYCAQPGWRWMADQDPALLPWAELGGTKRKREVCQKVAALLAAKQKEAVP